MIRYIPEKRTKFISGGFGYNTILCKARLDSSDFKIIAPAIERFITFKNGNLYYINDESALVRVRMDGSNLQKLCSDVRTVLAEKEDKIIFTSIDNITTYNTGESTHSKTVKSIYAVDFTGHAIRKLVYNINDAAEYDKNTIYYTTIRKESSADQSNRTSVLNKLDIDSFRTTHILNLNIPEQNSFELHKLLLVVAIIIFAIAVMCIFASVVAALIFALIGIGTIAASFFVKNKNSTLSDFR